MPMGIPYPKGQMAMKKAKGAKKASGKKMMDKKMMEKEAYSGQSDMSKMMGVMPMKRK
jgi:hypothetical protein